MNSITILDLLDLDLTAHNAIDLRCISGRKGLIRKIGVPDLNRPGLALSGFFDNFAGQRIQLFGRGEIAYLLKLQESGEDHNLLTFFTHNVPCCIFTHGLKPPKRFLELAEKSETPILTSELTSSEMILRLIRALSDIFSQKKTIHGVLVEVTGTGILILGESGIGKSETALELIERGHRLVADDAVEISCVSGSILVGKAVNKAIGHHMEIRGLGIINIKQMFGIGSIRERKQVQLVVQLEEWDSQESYDRIGAKENTMDILGVQIPIITIPVKPGRNIPIIIETAALNQRLKDRGENTAKEFNRSIVQWLESENTRNIYLNNMKNRNNS